MADNLAKDYAAGIVNDMIALEWLEDNYQDIEDWDMLEMLMKIDDIEAGAISAARYMVDDSGEHWDQYGGPVSAFFSNDVLDIETISKASAAAGSSYVSAVRALVTFGGPNAWIITSDGEDLEILVSWGGDTVKQYAAAAGVASYLYSIGGGE